MRRVYYTFATRIVSHTITMQIAVLCLSLYIFAKMVHVRSVIDNMLATELGSLPQFVASALLQGEVLTLMAIGVMTFVGLSLPLQIRSQFIPHLHTA